MMMAQQGALIGMGVLTLISGAAVAGLWPDLSRRARIFAVLWLLFWGVPPFITIWIKGVFG